MPALPITLEERARARHHLGYLGVAQSQTFVLGIPAAVQTQFMIEGALDKLLPESLDKFRQILSTMDGIEQQIVDDQELLAVSKVDEIDIRPDEFKRLIDQYVWWQSSLGNMLGITPNPFDQRFNAWGMGGGGSVNVNVNH